MTPRKKQTTNSASGQIHHAAAASTGSASASAASAVDSAPGHAHPSSSSPAKAVREGSGLKAIDPKMKFPPALPRRSQPGTCAPIVPCPTPRKARPNATDSSAYLSGRSAPTQLGSPRPCQSGNGARRSEQRPIRLQGYSKLDDRRGHLRAESARREPRREEAKTAAAGGRLQRTSGTAPARTRRKEAPCPRWSIPTEADR